MNDDFENQLRALAGKLERHDPTPGWKLGILSRANCETAPARAPRWLLPALAAAWAMIVILRATTPDTPAPRTTITFAPATSPGAPLRGLLSLNDPNLLP
jgi:hypothetical protein